MKPIEPEVAQVSRNFVVALVVAVVVYILTIPLRCWIWADAPQQCVRIEVRELVNTMLFSGSAIVSGWIGYVAGTTARRTWVGWCVGIGAFLLLAALLMAGGFGSAYREYGGD